MNSTKPADSESTRGNDPSVLLPPVDVYEDASGITLYADLPGVSKDKINVRIEADTLLINGELNLLGTSEMEASYAEIQCQQYQRSFTLGQEFDRDKLSAEFKQGVLRLHIPKVEKAKPRKIEVRVN